MGNWKEKKNIIITDSIAKYVAIDGCEMVPYRGAKIGDIKEEMRRNKDLRDFDNIILHVGTNNLGRQNPQIIMSEYMGLIEVAQRNNPGANIILSAILPRLKDQWEHGREIVQINKELKKYTKERGVKFMERHNFSDRL